jgi:hypothetical protein
MGFDIRGVRWEKVDDVLKTLSFSSRISHRSVIVISDDDVN